MATKIRLKSGIPAAWQEQVKTLRAYAPPPGTEEAWERYVEATVKRLENTYAYEQLGDLLDKRPEDEEVRRLWKELGERYDRLIRAELSFFDHWHHQVKHLGDKKVASEEEVRFVAIATLTDKTGDVQFNIKSGLLGSKLAQAIYRDTEEVEQVDPPLCTDCA